MKRHLVLTGALATILFGSTAQAQQSIGIHFNNGGLGSRSIGVPIPPMDPSEVAGIVPQANWNNTPANFYAYGVGPLTDQNGITLAGTSVSYQGNNTWAQVGSSTFTPGDDHLMRTYLDSSDKAYSIVLVTGLSALTTSNGTYDVYIYSNGDDNGPTAHMGRHGFFTLNNGNLDASGFGGMMLECTDLAAFEDSMTYVEDKQDGNGGNYVHFRGVSGDAIFILASPQNPTDPNDNGFRIPINNVQIVAN